MKKRFSYSYLNKNVKVSTLSVIIFNLLYPLYLTPNSVFTQWGKVQLNTPISQSSRQSPNKSDEVIEILGEKRGLFWSELKSWEITLVDYLIVLNKTCPRKTIMSLKTVPFPKLYFLKKSYFSFQVKSKSENQFRVWNMYYEEMIPFSSSKINFQMFSWTHISLIFLIQNY